MRIKLGSPLTLELIANAVGGRLSTSNQTITHITTDTRELKPGDLFIALRGNKYDGENYLNEVYKSGGFSLSKSQYTKGIIHQSPDCALLLLAEYYKKTLPFILYNIGITGSVGKSTTKEFLKILLSQRYKVHSSSGNFNNNIGMPMSMLEAPTDTQILLMEMGMNHPGEIERLSRCLHPDMALITNIGTAHIGNLGSRSAIAKAKLEITKGMNGGMIFLPKDEPLLNINNALTFSTDNPNADCYLSKHECGKVRIYKRGKLYCEADFNLTGEHHRKCLASAVAIAIETGIDKDELSNGISMISSYNIRQNVIFRENRTFYADYYNASRESVLAMIKWANETVKGNKKALLLGDILELGEMGPQIHIEIGRAISPTDFNSLYLFGDMSEYTALGAIEGGFSESRIFINRDLSSPMITANQIRENTQIDEPVFMKASRGVRLERVLNYFKNTE